MERNCKRETQESRQNRTRIVRVSSAARKGDPRPLLRATLDKKFPVQILYDTND